MKDELTKLAIELADQFELSPNGENIIYSKCSILLDNYKTKLLRELPRKRETSDKAIQAIFKDTTIGTLSDYELKEQKYRNEGFNNAIDQIKNIIKPPEHSIDVNGNCNLGCC